MLEYYHNKLNLLVLGCQVLYVRAMQLGIVYGALTRWA